MKDFAKDATAEEKFIRCLNRLRRELNSANWHFDIYKTLNEAKKHYLQELNQAAPFWGLTIDAHALLTLILLNRFFDKQERHLSVESLLTIAERNMNIFSDERFADRLKKADRFDEYLVTNRNQVTHETIQRHKQTVNSLPISGLRTWRNKLLAHIDKEWVMRDKDVRKTVRLNETHIQKIIDTLDDTLNYFHEAYDGSTWVKDIPLSNGIENVLDAVQKGLIERKKKYGL